MKTFARIIVATPLAVPVAALFTLEALIFVLAGLDLGDHTVPFVVQLRVAVFLAVWAALIYWVAWETGSIRRVFSRTFLALSVATFLFPIALIVGDVASSPFSQGEEILLPQSIDILDILLVLGMVFGLAGLLMAVVVAPPGAPERSLEMLWNGGFKNLAPQKRQDSTEGDSEFIHLYLRFLAAIPLSLPAAGLLAFALFDELGAIIPLLVIWAALVYWAAWGTGSFRRTVSRTFWAFTAAALFVPLSVLLFVAILIVWEVMSSSFPQDLSIPRASTVIDPALVLVIGFGINGILLAGVAVIVSPPDAPERSLEGLLQDTRETVRRIGGKSIAAALILLIVGVVMLRVGSEAGFWSEKYISIATHSGHTCGVRTDGTAHCWGADSAIPPQHERFVSIAPGSNSACGLREDGSISCWENTNKGGLSMPADSGLETRAGPFSGVTGGGEHYCGLLLEGTVECWGNDQYGETSPPEEERFTEISAGLRYTCGIRPDGTGVCWGSIKSQPRGERFKAISSGWNYACGIRVEEDVICWGKSGRHSPQNSPPVSERFMALDAGQSHACGLLTDGSAYCWGNTTTNETNDFGAEPVKGERFVSISSGLNYNCGLRENGTVKCWGGAELDRLYK